MRSGLSPSFPKARFRGGRPPLEGGDAPGTSVLAAVIESVAGGDADTIVLATSAEVTEVSPTLSADYPFEPPYTEQLPMEGEVGWDASAPSGVAGWKAFDLRGEGVPTNPENGTGDYVRGLGAELVPVPDREAFRAEVSAELSTSSLLELTDWSAGFTGTLVRIGDGSVSATHYVVEGSHAVGEASTGPTLVPGE